MAKQEITGKAFEYACIINMYNYLRDSTVIELIKDSSFDVAEGAFFELSKEEQNNYTAAAKKGVEIIIPIEPNLLFTDKGKKLTLSLQKDNQGQKGDVRDVVCVRNETGWMIGLSCKHNHEAVKHSRLSRTIDFGKEWLGYPVSEKYRKTIKTIFDELDELKEKKARWSGIEKKNERFYKTLLSAFLNEMRCLYEAHKEDVPQKLLCYFLGRFDFYKVIAHTNEKTTEVKPFNIYGSLGQSTKEQKTQYKIKQLQLPTQIISMDFKKNSLTTIIINCDNGWELSLRIHNASEWVESSLKFDIQLIGVPANLGTRIESWN